MPKYRCKACAHEVDAKFPPFACPQCKAKGKGFTEATGDATAAPVTAAVAAPPVEEPRFVAPPLRAVTAPQAPVAPPAPIAPPRESERIAWRYRLPAAAGERPRPLRGCPAFDAEGRLFVAMQNRLLMFAPGSSTPAWEYATADVIPRSPILGGDGHVRVHSSDGFLHVVDVAGAPAFAPVKVGNALGSAVPLVDRDGNAWICLYDGGLQRVDARGGTSTRPYFRTRRRFDSTGLILGDDLYVGCEDNHLYAVPLKAASGSNRWADGPGLGRTGCAINGAVALGPGPTLLVAGQDDCLHAFGLDGAERWSTPLPGQAIGSPIVDEQGNVYLGLAQNSRNRKPSGMLIAVDGATHQIKYRYSTESPVESTPVLGDDGSVYFGDNDGVIHAVDTHGRKLWDAVVGAAVRSAGAIFAERRLVFGLDDGGLVVLKCDSKRLCTGGWPKLHGPNL